jgi:hypothetical protein
MVAAALSATLMACDPPKSAEKAGEPTVTYEDVRGFSVGSPERTELDSVDDADIVALAQQTVSSTGYDCNSVDKLWLVKFTERMDIKVYKVVCDGAAQYQMTIFDGKTFAKPWTGVVLGT